MAEVVIHCILEPGTDPEQAAADLEAYLQGTEGIAPVVVEPEQPRAGLAEILAIVELANGLIDLTGKLVGFIKSRRDKAGEARQDDGGAQVRDIEIEIDGQRVPVGSLSPDQRARLAAAIAPGA